MRRIRRLLLTVVPHKLARALLLLFIVVLCIFEYLVIHFAQKNPKVVMTSLPIFLVTDRLCDALGCHGLSGSANLTYGELMSNGESSETARPVPWYSHCSCKVPLTDSTTFTALTERQFLTAIKHAMAPLPEASRPATIFIYGFNTSLGGTIDTTAVLSRKLSLVGPAIVYSWPSLGKLWCYSADRAIVDAASNHLSKFLLLLHLNGIRKTNVFVHSMGAVLLSQSLTSQVVRAGRSPLVTTVALAAPDVADIDARQALQVILHHSNYVDLYVSDRDLALRWSGSRDRLRRLGGGLPTSALLSGIPASDRLKLHIIDDSLNDCGRGVLRLLEFRNSAPDYSQIFGHGYYLTRPVAAEIALSFASRGTPAKPLLQRLRRIPANAPCF